MLNAQHRLKKKIAFNATYRTGISFYRNGITVFCGKNKRLDKDNFPTKIGFVVSKKIHKRAVKRNRIKRLMRESVRLYIKNNEPDFKQISLIFSASAKLIEKDFIFINNNIIELMDMIK